MKCRCRIHVVVLRLRVWILFSTISDDINFTFIRLMWISFISCTFAFSELLTLHKHSLTHSCSDGCVHKTTHRKNIKENKQSDRCWSIHDFNIHASHDSLNNEMIFFSRRLSGIWFFFCSFFLFWFAIRFEWNWCECAAARFHTGYERNEWLQNNVRLIFNKILFAATAVAAAAAVTHTSKPPPALCVYVCERTVAAIIQM